MNIIHYQSMIYFHFYLSFSQNILYMTIVKNIIVACFLMKIERTNYHHMFLLLTVKKNSVYYQLHDGEEYVLSKIMYM